MNVQLGQIIVVQMQFAQTLLEDLNAHVNLVFQEMVLTAMVNFFIITRKKKKKFIE